jgi:hypothetical protein
MDQLKLAKIKQTNKRIAINMRKEKILDEQLSRINSKEKAVAINSDDLYDNPYENSNKRSPQGSIQDVKREI